MFDIQLFDVYGYLNTVEWITKYHKIERRDLPVGGIHFFLKKLVSELIVDSGVACAFDSQWRKSEPLLEGYKSNRKRNPSIAAQADYLFRFLSKCGVPCYKGKGEADSYIFSMVEQFYPICRDHKIIVNGSDYDLCHNVDEEGVEYRTSNTNTLNVNWMNFSEVLRHKDNGYPVKFNTISAFKVLCYDVSDNVKPLKLSDGTQGFELYKEYIQLLDSFNRRLAGRVTRSETLLRKFLDGKNLPEIDMKLLDRRIQTVFPKLIPCDDPSGYKLGTKNSIDIQLLMDYAQIVDDKVSMGTLSKMGAKYKKGADLEELSQELYQFGRDYKNGVYMADNNLSLKRVNSFSETINVKDF
ncbi:hypothetical protein D3C81_932580 [compost metagenome]